MLLTNIPYEFWEQKDKQFVIADSNMAAAAEILDMTEEELRALNFQYRVVTAGWSFPDRIIKYCK